jgi:hypothetical protein
MICCCSASLRRDHTLISSTRRRHPVQYLFAGSKAQILTQGDFIKYLWSDRVTEILTRMLSEVNTSAVIAQGLRESKPMEIEL